MLNLRADCTNCFGLCCVAPAFAKSSDFAIDKPAGQACPNLQRDFRCGIHTKLRESGFPGCTVYDCFGAGQHVSQGTYRGEDWSKQPRMFETFPIMRNLHELLWYLNAALTFDDTPALRAQIRTIEQLTEGSPDELAAVDIDEQRRAVNPLLQKASERARKMVRKKIDRRGADLVGAKLGNTDLRGANLRGALLIGANLSNADLRLADVIGADLRGATLHGADLSETIFLIQAQLDAARGDRTTKLPPTLRRPAHWN